MDASGQDVKKQVKRGIPSEFVGHVLPGVLVCFQI